MSVTYNAENRPVRWVKDNIVITMNFDRMGRRVFYKEEVAGVVTKHHKFVYDNYLCVQKVNVLNNNAQINLFVWDPTEPIATRPLFTTGSGNRKFFYTCDGNKNVSELVHFETRNGIAAHYDYAPFGAVTRSVSASTITDNTFTTDNPFRFSSEYHDDTLGLVYYRERERTFHGHYRHYNPIDGRWCGRDPMGDYLDAIYCSLNLFAFSENTPLTLFDFCGLFCKDRCINGSVEVLCKIEFSTSIRGCSPETRRKSRELLETVSNSSPIMIMLSYLPVGSSTGVSIAVSDSLFSYFQAFGFSDAFGGILDLIDRLDKDSGVVLRAFATFEYKTCEEKCCFFKTYYDWNVKTSNQKEIMCTLNPESESWDEYVISLQNAIDRNFKKWMEDIGE